MADLCKQLVNFCNKGSDERLAVVFSALNEQGFSDVRDLDCAGSFSVAIDFPQLTTCEIEILYGAHLDAGGTQFFWGSVTPGTNLALAELLLRSRRPGWRQKVCCSFECGTLSPFVSLLTTKLLSFNFFLIVHASSSQAIEWVMLSFCFCSSGFSSASRSSSQPVATKRQM